MDSGRPLPRSNHAGLVGLIAIVASFVAHAEVPTASTAVPPKARPGYRGSALTYGHQATALSFDRAAEPQYNPTWSHRLGLTPQWHFNDQLFVRAQLFLAQELTVSDTTTRRYEVELSDLALQAGASGFTEPFTKIKLGGDVRVAFPTSKLSHGATRLLAIGPGLALSRTFGFGLSLAYTGRYSYRFHRYTTGQNDAPTILACGNPLASECAEFLTTGKRNAHSDLTHGVAIGFAPIQKLSINAAFHLSHLWLYPLSAVPAEVGPIVEATDTPVRSYTNFELAVGWQLFKPIGVTVGASTFSPQLNTAGTRTFPLFNRNTTLYLDLSFDVEAAVSGLLGEST